jgi:hypothetical protein
MRLAGSRNFWALERFLPAETRQHVRRFIATAYYFAISGPVIDPVPVAPEAVEHGFPGYYTAVEGGAAGVACQNAGLSGMGLSDGLAPGFVGDERAVFAGNERVILAGKEQVVFAGNERLVFAGNERVILAGLGSAGLWRKEGFIAFGKRSEPVIL